MTMFALRVAGKVNAVSKLHAKKAAEIWTNHPIMSIQMAFISKPGIK